MTKSKKLDFTKANFSKIDFFTSRARFVFIYLWKTFIEALIIYHFHLEFHIQIIMDVLGYHICGVLSQLILDQLSFNHLGKNWNFSKYRDVDQWHLVTFFSKKIILAETWYKTYDQELLGIIEAFKTWYYYLED